MKFKIFDIKFKIIALLTTLLVFVCFANVQVARADDALVGSGSKNNPYLISSVDDVKFLSESVNGGNEYKGAYFLQTADIDCSSLDGFAPIGVYDGGYYFKGVYDGGGYEIVNLKIDNKTSANNGFFGMMHGTVLNLTFRNCSVEGDCVAMVASHGNGDAKIINCAVVDCNIKGATRAGVIADNLSGGVIFACVDQSGTSLPLCSYNSAILNYCFSNNLYAKTFTGDNQNNSAVLENSLMSEKVNENLVEVSTIYANYDLRSWSVVDGRLQQTQAIVKVGFGQILKSYWFGGVNAYKTFKAVLIVIVVLAVSFFAIFYGMDFYKKRKVKVEE